MKPSTTFLFLAAAAFAATMSLTAPAQAQASRTWISGVGDDANPCSRTAPCKTFAGAISKTMGGGEIDCLDPGGFGAVTITKAITLDCGSGETGMVGSILPGGTNGIVVSAGANDRVEIRKLEINGVSGTGVPGINGIRFLSGKSLHIDNVNIMNFSTNGVDMATAAAASMFLNNVNIMNCGNNGVNLLPTGGGVVNVSVRDVRVSDCATSGVTANGTGAGPLRVSIENSLATNGGAGFIATTTSGTTNMEITGSAATNNSGDGVQGNGASANVFIGSSLVSGNQTGVHILNSGNVLSYKNNQIDQNVSNGTPVSPIGLN